MPLRNKMFSTRTSYFMKNPEIFVLSLICRANIFSLRFKTLPRLKLLQKPQHRDKCKFDLNLEIRVQKLYFVNENILHVNNKNKPCLLTSFLDFLSPNSQIGAFAFRNISFSDKLAAMSVRQYISSVFRLCYLNRFICTCIYLKLNEETNMLERKAIFTSAQASTEL